MNHKTTQDEANADDALPYVPELTTTGVVTLTLTALSVYHKR
ncbi:hypothetical protein AB6D30_06345 [Pectobacterium brasiliense]|nr:MULTISPECIES: hypothetical protein [Pectobacterium]MDY4335962.1 hypothetical protein [Pectobacterium brasiliense]